MSEAAVTDGPGTAGWNETGWSPRHRLSVERKREKADVYGNRNPRK